MPLVRFETGDQPADWPDEAVVALERLAGKGMVQSVIAHDGELLAVIGVAPLDGRVQVFAVGTEARFRHQMDFVRSIRKALAVAVEHFGAQALEARCDASIARAGQFLEYLGFVPAGEDAQGLIWRYVP